MKIVVGLGNPGPDYAKTRHNVGFMVIDRLAARYAPGAVARQRFQSMTIETTLPERSPRDWDEAKAQWASEPSPTNRVLLMKPMTYMNLSGRAVAEAVRFYKVNPETDLLIIVDEVALPCGDLRLRASGSAGGHNGLSDIERLLASDKYDRCRIGIDPPGRIPQRDYVLGRFTDEQTPAIERGIDRAAAAVQLWASEGIVSAGNVFNAKKPKREKQPGPSERAMLAKAKVASEGNEAPDPDPDANPDPGAGPSRPESQTQSASAHTRERQGE